MDIRILDCTLRDGGYYNKWDFDSDLVNDYLLAMASAGVDYVELGLRQFRNDQYLGASAYTTYEYLARLSLPDGPTYGVMVDAKTILASGDSQEECVNALFRDRNEEKISLVRIAAHFHEVSECFQMVCALKAKGYLVGLNIMQASLRGSIELTAVTKLVSDWNKVDVLYFADSLGSMDADDIERVYKAMRCSWSGDIGFHAHNNIGEAIANINCAIDLGCVWVDGTVAGMGRGAGNAELEYLLQQPRIQLKAKELDDLSSLIINYFEPLKKHHGWGLSMAYYSSAKLGIHPSYIQELCSEVNLDRRQIPKIIGDLGLLEHPHVFAKSTLDNVISKTNNDVAIVGDKVSPFLAGKEIILVAQTDLSVKYKDAISDYAVAKNAVLIAINLPLEKLDIAYDFVAVSHNQKYRDDEKNYVNSNYRFIAPRALFEGSGINVLHNYGLWVKEGVFECYGNYAAIPNRLTLAYAVAFCIDAQAEKISMVGFGGYSSENPKQKEMQEFLALLKVNDVKLQSLTPTTYAISEVSVFCV
jgi:4-hydroxy 2-oxovalerate aldolase